MTREQFNTTFEFVTVIVIALATMLALLCGCKVVEHYGLTVEQRTASEVLKAEWKVEVER